MNIHPNPVVQKRRWLILKYMRIIAVTFLVTLKDHEGELQICKEFHQRIFADAAQSGFKNSLLVNKDPRWLRWNFIFTKDQRSSVIKVVKGQRMTINKVEV